MSNDFLIIGGGIIGLSIAREIKRRYPSSKITLIEKEKELGTHASGRNSGVIHAGFYYSANSLKAKFTRQGNLKLTAYCEEKKIPLNKCGKLVVAKDENDLPGLDELLDRAKKNGVPLSMISKKEAEEIEPRVKTFEKALFSPTTSAVSPKAVVKAMEDDAIKEGITIVKECKYLAKTTEGINTTKGPFYAKYIVNAAGLYADKIALDYGFSKDYRILPFKGLYLYSDEAPFTLKTHIYPVPDLKYPFLGVHFTLTSEGHTKIGPTAIPAFWREQYDKYRNFQVNECLSILSRQCSLLFSDPSFKHLAYREICKYSRNNMVKLASTLLKDVSLKNYIKWGKPGIRAQLVNIKNLKLEMDFVIEHDNFSMHVLNAVSPAFTCAFSFSEYVVDQII